MLTGSAKTKSPQGKGGYSVMQGIPNSVIGAVSSVLGAYYYSHSRLNSLFMESGAPGDVPEGNCEDKCARWLKRCNDDPNVDALTVLGRVIQSFMDDDNPMTNASADKSALQPHSPEISLPIT